MDVSEFMTAPDKNGTPALPKRAGRNIVKPTLLRNPEVQVSSLPQQPPIGEVLAEGHAPVLGEAEDVELLVINEVGAVVLPEVRLDPAQVLYGKAKRGVVVVGRCVVAWVHNTSCGSWSAFSTTLAKVLCVLEGPKIPQGAEAARPETPPKTRGSKWT